MNILIWYPVNELAPVGGPAGYLFNLKEKLDDSSFNFEFLPDTQSVGSGKSQIKKRIRKKFKFFLDNVTIKKIIDKKDTRNIDLSRYDAIHFHSTKDLYFAREIIKDYKGKIVLTSHSPKPLHQEIINDELQVGKFQKIIFKNVMDSLSKVDIFAFERADYIIFPCKEAEEPYSNNWEWYREFSIENSKKYKYIPTCINEVNYKTNKRDILKKYGIPEGAKVLCYVGRHNETKGYDALKKIGESILRSHQDVYFLIAGKEEPLKGLTDSRWIEVGWTKDPHSIINASDIFILPNKETYFDLILLEVLSLGKPVLLSNTGGNKYFKKFSSNGFKYFHNVNEAKNELSDLVALNKNDLNSLGEQNRDIFISNFKTDIFVSEYEKVLKTII